MPVKHLPQQNKLCAWEREADKRLLGFIPVTTEALTGKQCFPPHTAGRNKSFSCLTLCGSDLSLPCSDISCKGCEAYSRAGNISGTFLPHNYPLEHLDLPPSSLQFYPFVAGGILLPFIVFWHPRPGTGNRLLCILTASTIESPIRFTSIKCTGKAFPTLVASSHESAELAAITTNVVELRTKGLAKNLILFFDCLSPSHLNIQLKGTDMAYLWGYTYSLISFTNWLIR